MRAADVVDAWPTMPKAAPHMKDWKAWIPSGTGMAEMPSMLRSGIATNPVVQMVTPAGAGGPLPPAPMSVEVVPRIPNGSGEVVEDCFH